MEVFIICGLVLILFILGLYPIYKIGNKQSREAGNNILLIEQRMASIRTVEDCLSLQKEISEYHRNTDVMFKELRKQYEIRYYMINGIRYAIENEISLIR